MKNIKEQSSFIKSRTIAEKVRAVEETQEDFLGTTLFFISILIQTIKVVVLTDRVKRFVIFDKRKSLEVKQANK